VRKKCCFSPLNTSIGIHWMESGQSFHAFNTSGLIFRRCNFDPHRPCQIQSNWAQKLE
jgi:hypothetical protein